MKDIQNRALAVPTIVPIVGNNTTEGTGTAVDLTGCDGARWIYAIGASGDTLSGSVYMTVTFQHSDTTTPGDFADCALADLTGGAASVVIDAAAEDEVVVQRGYIGAKRYLRGLVTFTGTHTNGTPISCVIDKHYIRHQPPTIAP